MIKFIKQKLIGFCWKLYFDDFIETDILLKCLKILS